MTIETSIAALQAAATHSGGWRSGLLASEGERDLNLPTAVEITPTWGGLLSVPGCRVAANVAPDLTTSTTDRTCGHDVAVTGACTRAVHGSSRESIDTMLLRRV